MIELQQICKSFKTRKVLDQLSLDFHEGESHAIMGTNGAGKTTLARIIAGLEQPSSGSIIGLEKIKTMLMQQDFVIWPELTVIKNMMIAADKKTSQEWLEKTNLIKLMKTKAGQLSHGQKQRLSIARAMAFQPQLLIVDEAFSYLDPPQANDSRNLILSELREPNNQLSTIIWITQSAEEAFSVANQLSIIENGQISNSGTPEKVYQTPSSITAAKMTGHLSVIPHQVWQEHQKAILLPENTTPPSNSESLAFRPECCDIEPVEHPNRGFKLTNSHFTPRGYLSSIETIPTTKIQTSTLPKQDQNYRLILNKSPLIFSES